VARNRQQAKQRQAERRARRLEQQGDGAAKPKEAPAPAAKDELGGLRPPPVEPPMMDPNLAVGAPPQDEGRSDTVIEDEPHVDDHEDEHLTDDEVDAEAQAEAELAAGGDTGFKVQGRRGADTQAHKKRPRVVQFLVAVWAELQRVQWPDRQALTTLTGVVLGFVLIMGGYLGLLDAIFSELINAIL
jgi:preprotein translocase SecE subunit